MQIVKKYFRWKHNNELDWFWIDEDRMKFIEIKDSTKGHKNENSN